MIKFLFPMYCRFDALYAAYRVQVLDEDPKLHVTGGVV